MGWSCRREAMNTLQKIGQTLCIGRSQNVYKVNGTEYMIETSNKEHDDGAITGSIFNLTKWSGKSCGNFRISPEGAVERGPKVFKLAAEGKPIPNLEVPSAKN